MLINLDIICKCLLYIGLFISVVDGPCTSPIHDNYKKTTNKIIISTHTLIP